MPVSRKNLAVVALLVIAGVGLYVLWPRDHAPKTSPSATDRKTYQNADETASPALTGTTPSFEAPSVALLEQRLADYKAASVYPPWSGPLSEATIDKLEWNRTIVSDLPMDDRPGHETTYHFGADRWTVPYGEAFTSWIEVMSGNQRLPLQILEARLVSAETGEIAPLTYHDDGQDGDAVAGDHRYSNRVTPTSFPKLAAKAQQVQLEAIVEAGGVRRPMTRDFAYAPRKAAEIIGASESLRDGSLVVTLDVDVHEKGLYTFSANAFASDNTPIVFGDKSYTFEPGKHTADVVLFGRAFVESAKDGPYVIRDIRGMRRFIDTDEQNFYFTYGKSLTSRPYTHGQFSSAEWNDPERTDKIAAFERLIDETRAGVIGQNAGSQVVPPPIAPEESTVPPTAPTKPH